MDEMRSSGTLHQDRPARMIRARWLGAAALAALLVVSLLPARATRSHADVLTATIFGFVAPDSQGAVPTKVRALGPSIDGQGPVVCGTGDVVLSGNAVGFYIINVTSTLDRAGCPDPGGEVHFLLLYGSVDPGIEAGQVATWEPGVQRVDLAAGPRTVDIGGFAGFIPSGTGYALMTWHGPSDTPIEQAILTIPRQVGVVYLLSQTEVQLYVAGQPAVSDLRSVNDGDIVAVFVLG
jgi:hypothetical protein